jgi:hypothetical protein
MSDRSRRRGRRKGRGERPAEKQARGLEGAEPRSMR